MKFLVDAQLPKTLSDFLNSQGLNAVHTLELPDQNKTKDGYIARLAAEENRIVITKDADFLESYLIKKEPPKLLLLKTGNIRNSELLVLLQDHLELLKKYFRHHALVEMTRQEIIVHE
jgi:predicted nuclease of predicted toxin-antitoxin system